MASLKETDAKKWINALVAIIAIITGYVSIAFFNQLGEWFELEAKVNSYNTITQFAGIFVGLATFLGVVKNAKSFSYLSEVYHELTKVVWPDHDSTTKLAVSIVVGVAIASIFLGVVDFGVQKVLELLY